MRFFFLLLFASVPVLEILDFCVIIRAGMINQSIIKILLIIDCKSVVSIMLIIPKDILFKHAAANNVQYLGDRKPF